MFAASSPQCLIGLYLMLGIVQGKVSCTF